MGSCDLEAHVRLVRALVSKPTPTHRHLKNTICLTEFFAIDRALRSTEGTVSKGLIGGTRVECLILQHTVISVLTIKGVIEERTHLG